MLRRTQAHFILLLHNEKLVASPGHDLRYYRHPSYATILEKQADLNAIEYGNVVCSKWLLGIYKVWCCRVVVFIFTNISTFVPVLWSIFLLFFWPSLS